MIALWSVVALVAAVAIVQVIRDVADIPARRKAETERELIDAINTWRHGRF